MNWYGTYYILLRLYLEQGVSYIQGHINSILNINIASIDDTKYHNNYLLRTSLSCEKYKIHITRKNSIHSKL